MFFTDLITLQSCIDWSKVLIPGPKPEAGRLMTTISLISFDQNTNTQRSTESFAQLEETTRGPAQRAF